MTHKRVCVYVTALRCMMTNEQKLNVAPNRALGINFRQTPIF